MNAEADRLLEIEGTVQGVGFRPFVARLAARHGVRGWVRNDLRGVRARVAGERVAVEAFVAELQTAAPPAARITGVRTRNTDATCDPPAGDGFVIVDSEIATGLPSVAVTPDLALCADCRRELAERGNRREAYPFINCTNCGPRYTIIRELPYDRPRTTMAEFTLCAACEAEFLDPANRRFHAQPNACPRCGPHVEFCDPAGQVIATHGDAIAQAAAALDRGAIVAAKGIGGFHLLVDAANESAVNELRRRKRRDEKPFAVMFPSLAALGAAAELSELDVAALTSTVAPIVLVRRRADAAIAAAVAPNNPWLGALLPYSPLHVLLLEAMGRPVVATSGNLSEEPLCTDNAEARERLGTIADRFLMHNRAIARPVDDSVARTAEGGTVWLRRARGLAPAPLCLPGEGVTAGPLLCVGAQLKSTIAVTAGSSVVLSPHLGDLGNLISVAAFRRAVELLGSLYGGRFAGVVCDAHPDYVSTRFAESLGLPVTRVQHHLAHILACLLEHDGAPEKVLGVAWDGTGYGSDGTIWGGEFIVVDRAARRARRVAHLHPFRLPGGEAAVREPRRTALALLYELGIADEARGRERFAQLGFEAREIDTWLTLLPRGAHAPVTTSAGRLFDGVAALLGLRQRCSFEGQAAMELEFAAARAADAADPWPLPLVQPDTSAPARLDWRPMIRALLEAPRADAAGQSARFHATLVAGIVAAARHVGIETVVLTGGCFQNLVLLSATTRALRAAGFRVLRARELPPNDGAIAAGQALAAWWGLTEVEARGAAMIG